MYPPLSPLRRRLAGAAAAGSASFLLLVLGVAPGCSDDRSGSSGTPTTSDASDGASASDGTADATSDGSLDGNRVDDGGTILPTPPSVHYLGRFDESDPAGPRMGWPGGRVVGRFDGTQVSAKITQTAGSVASPTYVNVIVDGTVKTPLAVDDGTQAISLATGLPAGTHTIEIEKRTDGRLGFLRFEGFAFGGGKGLLAPSARLKRRIEVLGDDLVSGFGVDGDATKCAGGAPPQYDDVRKSVGAVAARALDAEINIVAHPGKGLLRNQDGSTTETFPAVLQRSLPETSSSSWSFSSYVPDVVVIVLGAADWDGTQFPANLQATYNQLITDTHARYLPTTKVLLVVWSQHHSTSGMRAALTAIVDAVVAGRPNADKPHNSTLLFPEAAAGDETGCQGHANAAHHAAMAGLLVAEIRTKLGW
ncbi:MAG: hypothetical protein JST00_28190 [Deltaproteobacteria bacterium]|nr:hypothetical protein [Deltaproteobacteria bacterium]